MSAAKSNSRKLWVLAVLVAAVAGCKFYFPTTTERFTVTKNVRSLANGKNLAQNMCAGCHYDESTKKYSGIALNDLPRIGGKLYSANLTHSALHGKINQYSDAELFYLIKRGIGRTGKFMPYMMRPTLADADINDLVVYFRSNDAPLAAADTTVGNTKINLIGRWGIRATSAPAPFVEGVARPDEANAVVYGKYLGSAIGCYHCHSKKIAGLNYVEPEKSKGYFQGGMKTRDVDGKTVRASNLTPDDQTGIGRYTAADFRRAVVEGKKPDGRMLSTAMPRFRHLNVAQANAVYAYLRQLPAVAHRVR